MAQVRNRALRLWVRVQEVQPRTHGDAVRITEVSAAHPCKELLQLCLHVPVFHAGQRRRCLAAVTAGITAVTAGAVFAVKDRKSTRLNSSHVAISYAVFCLKI